MLIYRDGMLFIHLEIRDAKRSKRLYRFTDVSGFLWASGSMMCAFEVLLVSKQWMAF